jgi:hypothetical protein
MYTSRKAALDPADVATPSRRRMLIFGIAHERTQSIWASTPASSDTAESRLTLRGVTHGTKADGTALVSIWFHFDWQLPSGRKAPFDAIDMLELTDGSRVGRVMPAGCCC